MSARQQLAALERFDALLRDPAATEAAWQSLFAQCPYILSRSLPFRVDSRRIQALGRRGRSEPDFIIHPDPEQPHGTRGIIELKGHRQPVLTFPRKDQVILTRAASTAVNQVHVYSEAQWPDRLTVLGNDRYLFVIMGLSRTWADHLLKDFVQQQIRGQLRGVTLLGYDQVFENYQASIPRRVVLLVPDTPDCTLAMETGFAGFDRMTGGLHPGHLVIIAGRPSMGKTAFVCNVAERVARAGKAVAFFSLEMTSSNIRRYMRHSIARVVAGTRGDEKNWTPDEAQRMQDATSSLLEAPLFIDDQPRLSPTSLRRRARKFIKEHDAQLVVLDYLQLMNGDDEMMQSAHSFQRHSHISRSLRELVRELDVPVLAISQLNRDAERRSGNRPVLADLGESARLREDADLICLLFRKYYYTKVERERRAAELVIAKNPAGPLGSVKLRFHEAFMRFEDP